MLFAPAIIPHISNTYAKWDSVSRIGAGITLSGSSLTAAGGADNHRNIGTTIGIGVSTDSAYWEVLVNSLGAVAFSGMGNSSYDFTGVGVIGNAANSYGLDSLGRIWNNGSTSGSVSTFTNGDRMSYCFKGGSFWVGKGGVWLNSGDPANNTGALITGLTGTMYPGWSDNVTGMNVTANFGASSPTYTVPAGFKAGVYT